MVGNLRRCQRRVDPVHVAPHAAIAAANAYKVPLNRTVHALPWRESYIATELAFHGTRCGVPWNRHQNRHQGRAADLHVHLTDDITGRMTRDGRGRPCSEANAQKLRPILDPIDIDIAQLT